MTKLDLNDRNIRKQIVFPWLYGKKLSDEDMKKCVDFINNFKPEKKND